MGTANCSAVLWLYTKAQTAAMPLAMSSRALVLFTALSSTCSTKRNPDGARIDKTLPVRKMDRNTKGRAKALKVDAKVAKFAAYSPSMTGVIINR